MYFILIFLQSSVESQLVLEHAWQLCYSRSKNSVALSLP
jgi:hypothetical protein